MGKGNTSRRRPSPATTQPNDPAYAEEVRLMALRRLAKQGVYLAPDAGSEYVAELARARKGRRARPQP